MTLSKSRISLKSKELSDGRKSLYLDYYKDGKRIRESLRLYLLPESDHKAVALNKETMAKATELQRRRIEELTAQEKNLEIATVVPEIPLSKVIKDYHDLILNRGDKSTASNIMGMYRAIVA